MKYISLFSLIIGTAIIIGCDKNGPNPSLKFFTENNYTFEDDTIVQGDSVLVGLKCTWNGSDLLMSLNTFLNDNLIKTSNINPPSEGFGIEFWITKSAIEIEKWDFELADTKGQKAALSLTLTKDTSTATAKEITGIVLVTHGNQIMDGF